MQRVEAASERGVDRRPSEDRLSSVLSGEPSWQSLGTARAPLWIRGIFWTIGLLPYRALGLAGSLLGFLAGTILRIRRAHVIASMSRAGIERPSSMAAAMYASLGRGLFELFWSTGRPPRSLDEHFHIARDGAERLRAAMALGRGVVVATAHTGNWDFIACAAARWLRCATSNLGRTANLHVVTKRLSIEPLDRAWQRLRAERGVILVDAKGATRHVRAALSAGDFVAMLIDQVPERKSGVATFPFLGAPALHDLAPAMLASRARAPIVLAFGRRSAGGRHVLDVVDVILPDEMVGHEAIVAVTSRMAEKLDAYVRAHPSQWLWMHRRWKGVTSLKRSR